MQEFCRGVAFAVGSWHALAPAPAADKTMVNPRERAILHHLWTAGPTSRLELAGILGLTPNIAGDLVAALLKRGLLRECDKNVRGRGRPSIPVEIDSAGAHLLGLALQRGRVQVARINLRGQPVGAARSADVHEPLKLVRTATRLLDKELQGTDIAVGVSITGFVDQDNHRLLLSSALGGLPDADLSPIYAALPKTPLCLQNDMHALAARWLLTQHAQATARMDEDALIVLLADGQVGSTLLVNGRPNDGCVMGGNELGHMRFPLATDRCYCGAIGCVERIFSSEYARARLGLVGDLPAMIERYDGRRSPMGELLSLTANALANAVNFVRPHRLVITSPFTRHAVFTNELLKRTRECFLPALADRVRIDLWEQPVATPAETAGFLPLASLLLDVWGPALRG